MSFYTALTGLNGSQSDISATSNNIANVNTTGFKRSRAEFGDIFATSPLQNASSSIGSGTILKGVKQQFTQGNISSSLNALDLAISGQGFFALQPSLTSTQTVYTRNGSFNVNNDRYVVDSSGQFVNAYPVNADGSVTAKDLTSANPLQLPITSGTPQATSSIDLGVNVPATAEVIPAKAAFSSGYAFNAANPETYNNSTSITIFDDLGNPTIATIYFIRTQAASAADPTNKFETRLVINDTVIEPDLVPSVSDTKQQIFIDRFGQQTTSVPDDNYFLEGKGSALYKADSLNTLVDSTPAKITGETSAFDFGDEGDKTVTIVTDPVQYNSTRESGDTTSNVYWGKDFLTINVDNADTPITVDIRPGSYNAAQLATEIQRAINVAYGDDKKIQVVQNVDDTVTIDLLKLNADGTSTGLTTAVSVDLLSSSYVSDIEGITLTGASPDFTREQFLAHTQARLNATLNEYAVTATDTVANATTLGVDGSLFARNVGSTMTTTLAQNQVFNLKYRDGGSASAGAVSAVTETDQYLTYSYYGSSPSLNVYDSKNAVAVNNSSNTVEYDQAENTVKIFFGSSDPGFTANEKVRVMGLFDESSTETTNGVHLNGREFTVSSATADSNGNYFIQASTAGMNFPDSDFNLTETNINVYSDISTEVEGYFEGAQNVFKGAEINFSNKKIVLREIGTANKHKYTNDDIIQFSGEGIISVNNAEFTLTNADGTNLDSMTTAGFSPTTLTLDTTSSSIVSTGNNTFTSTAHGLVTGDTIVYKSGASGSAVTLDTSGSNVNTTNNTLTNTTLDALDEGTAIVYSAAGNGSAVTISTTAPVNNTITHTAAHGFNTGDAVTYAASGVALTGLTNATVYYAVKVDAKSFKLATSYENATGKTQSVISLTATNGSATDTFTPKDPLTGLSHGRTYFIADPSNSGNTIKLAESFSDATASTAVTINFSAQDGNSSDTFKPTDDMTAMEHGRTYYVIKSDEDTFKVATTLANAVAGTNIGLTNADGSTTDTFTPLSGMTEATHWVDEKDPAIEVSYDELNQRLEFEVDRNILGTGTDSNFSSFKLFGASTATAENNLGIPALANATSTLIKGGEKFSGATFVADGAEIQLNDKRFGVKVVYNSELKAFDFKSGTTGEAIAANGALNVTTTQSASDISVGRYSLSTTDGSIIDATDYFAGDNQLLGIGATKTSTVKTEAKGLAAQAAVATGAAATEDLTTVFRLNNTNNENIFNVSINGISGVIEIPTGFYVGSTLAEALQTRINQVENSSGIVGGGVTVAYNSATNNFSFTNGTTGSDSTIKVKGAARFGLDNVDLGVGSVPQIYNLIQATNTAGVALYVDALGNKVETPPADLVTGYFPLYIDEGELTFDKSGTIVSPKQGVHYEKQEAGFSIDLDIDFTKSTQLAQPFSVTNVTQDGFTSGRLDGLEIDASGTVRANYTNGQNNPLGKIVLANFNNQNGLKQIGNATYVETAVSGTATVGEAGSEGFGTILSGSLERSNVDITEELVNLITAQRNFQANAKSIETTAATTQQIVNIRM
jgi:flagellar hook protein FlgE